MQAEYACYRCLKASKFFAKSQNSSLVRRRRFSSLLTQHQHKKPRQTLDHTLRRNQTSSSPQEQEPDKDVSSLIASFQQKRDRQRDRVLARQVELSPDDLFHPLSSSPSPEMRRRGAFIKTHAWCPHPSHRPTRPAVHATDPEARKISGENSQSPAFVKFECPDCGIPSYCSEEHWEDDYELHMQICETLRQINEDDHDLRSRRKFSELEYPNPTYEGFPPNMMNWDTFLYTRNFNAIDDERALRQATKLLSYPVTIGSIIHELSPYNIRKNGRLTFEGLRSLTALRHMLHPIKQPVKDNVKTNILVPPPIRIFVLGARAESSLPRSTWLQMAWLFPRVVFHVIFIGPESMVNRESELPLPERTPSNPFGAVIEDQFAKEIKFSTYVDYFHTLYNAQEFQPFDPYFDCFVLFHPGLGHPGSSHEWQDTIPQLLETKCPIICTGYSEWDMERDRKWVEDTVGGEMDVVMHPGENRFRGLRWDLNDYDPTEMNCSNWGVWAFRGKRYEAQMKD